VSAPVYAPSDLMGLAGPSTRPAPKISIQLSPSRKPKGSSVKQAGACRGRYDLQKQQVRHPLAVGRWCKFHESECHLGNVGQM
jgi:hypothetical protein